MTECNLWFCRMVQYQHLGEVAFAHIVPASIVLLFLFSSRLLSSFLFPFHSSFLPTTISYIPTPWSPLSLLPLLPFYVLLIRSCSLLLSLTLLLPLLSHSFLSSYLSLFPFSHLILCLLCPTPLLYIAPHFCHSTPLLPMHRIAFPFTPLIALPICGSFFLVSPPPLSSTAATKTPPPRNVSMDQLYSVHSVLLSCFHSVMQRHTHHNCVYFTHSC